VTRISGTFQIKGHKRKKICWLLDVSKKVQNYIVIFCMLVGLSSFWMILSTNDDYDNDEDESMNMRNNPKA